MSLLYTEVGRETGILFFDTDEIINAVETNDVFKKTDVYVFRKSLLEFAVSFLKCLGEQLWQQKY